MGRPPVQVIDGRKRCSKCREMLPTEDFHTDYRASTGLSAHCIDCRKAWRDENITPEISRARRLERKYGITVEEYDRLYQEQDGRCAICSVDPSGEVYEKFSVDHDHATGKVRGLLCRECNFGLGKFADDPNRLLAAAAYVLGTGVF